jgi:phosphatidylglycerophosphate synthase
MKFIKKLFYITANLKLDDAYTKFILNRTSFFKYINPNLITIIGLLTDFFILYFLINKLLIFLGLSLFIRYSADCLDGAVARKYKKVSDLGGILDTLADNTLIFIVSYGITLLLDSKNFILSILIVSLNLYYLYNKKALIHHANVKKEKVGDLFHNIYGYFVNNNFILYILILIIFIILINP